MNIFQKRPFKIRNAEDFEISKILDIFVNPLDASRSPFDFENSIIKGEMGSGKSILLKANYAFYLYSIVPSLLSDEPVILPVQIRLSDYQHIRDPDEIYKNIIYGVIKGIAKVYSELQSAQRLMQIHEGMRSLPKSIFQGSRLDNVLGDLVEMQADAYKAVITKELGFTSKLKSKFMELGAQFKKTRLKEITGSRNPGISDVHAAYEFLLGDFNGSILLLIDEAGSLEKSFFRGGQGTSLFEVIMNQFRTAEYLRTKIAVYPHSHSDVLVETRYGDLVYLNENITDTNGYKRFRERAIGIIDKYVESASREEYQILDIFDINPSPDAEGDSLEQVIYASNGNMRRLLSILDTCMQQAYSEHNGDGKINPTHVAKGLRTHSESAESIFNANDKEFLNTLAKTCRSRSTYRFRFPQKAPLLAKFLNKSEEHNLISITEAGSGRRGTTYEFDYAFCVNHNIPTHYIKDSERVDKNRSRKTGDWISRIAQISEEIIEHAHIAGKLEGEIDHVGYDSGFARTDSGEEYYINRKDVIESDRNKTFIQGRRVRFYPVKYEDSNLAYSIEIL